jgi:hypothetical protein
MRDLHPHRLSVVLPRAASAGLVGLAALHAAWGAGSAWPLHDREALADSVVGRPAVPSPAACATVSALLLTAAAFVAGHPRGLPRVRRTGAAGVAGVFATRAALGLAGRTDLVSKGSTSPRFRELDRRLYSPACLTLAVLSLPAAVARPA